jgi:Family of unknown function (DUF6352)
MSDFWMSCGYRDLQVDARGWLVPTEAWLARWLARPELAPVDESCAAERALHGALSAAPWRAVAAAELDRIADADVRDNWRHWLRFRDALRAAGTIEAYYLALMRSGQVDIPPLFVDLLVQVIVRHLLDTSDDAFEARAGELLFRTQRLSTTEGQVLAGDRDTLDLLNETGGFGELGRLLAQAQAPLRRVQVQVLSDDNAASYWTSDARFDYLLDLRHDVTQDLGHGVRFTMDRARSGLKALSRVLERWVRHLLGVTVTIRPAQRIDDPQWRWHVGLDAEASAVLDALYRGEEVAADRLQRLVSLFRLDFANPAEMRADVAGRPVYLGLAMTAAQTLRLKPQNLLLNLPLAAAS